MGNTAISVGDRIQYLQGFSHPILTFSEKVELNQIKQISNIVLNCSVDNCAHFNDGVVIYNSTISNITIRNGTFSRADLHNVIFINATIENSTFEGMGLDNVVFKNTNVNNQDSQSLFNYAGYSNQSVTIENSQIWGGYLVHGDVVNLTIRNSAVNIVGVASGQSSGLNNCIFENVQFACPLGQRYLFPNISGAVDQLVLSSVVLQNFRGIFDHIRTLNNSAVYDVSINADQNEDIIVFNSVSNGMNNSLISGINIVCAQCTAYSIFGQVSGMVNHSEISNVNVHSQRAFNFSVIDTMSSAAITGLLIVNISLDSSQKEMEGISSLQLVRLIQNSAVSNSMFTFQARLLYAHVQKTCYSRLYHQIVCFADSISNSSISRSTFSCQVHNNMYERSPGGGVCVGLYNFAKSIDSSHISQIRQTFDHDLEYVKKVCIVAGHERNCTIEQMRVSGQIETRNTTNSKSDSLSSIDSCSDGKRVDAKTIITNNKDVSNNSVQYRCNSTCGPIQYNNISPCNDNIGEEDLYISNVPTIYIHQENPEQKSEFFSGIYVGPDAQYPLYEDISICHRRYATAGLNKMMRTCQVQRYDTTYYYSYSPNFLSPNQPWLWLFIAALIVAIILAILLCIFFDRSKCSCRRKKAKDTQSKEAYVLQSGARSRVRPQTQLTLPRAVNQRIASQMNEKEWQKLQAMGNSHKRTYNLLYQRQSEASASGYRSLRGSRLKPMNQLQNRTGTLNSQQSSNVSGSSGYVSDVITQPLGDQRARQQPNTPHNYIEHFSDSEPGSTFNPEQDTKWRLMEQQMTIRSGEVKKIYNGEELFSDANLIEVMKRQHYQQTGLSQDSAWVPDNQDPGAK